MPIVIFVPIRATRADFIEFWSRQYFDNTENLYVENACQELNEQRVLSLYLWKNGRRLSRVKEVSVRRNFVQRIEELNNIQPNTGAREFLERFADGGAIWRIFWLHCWQPLRFPIYDQHVHRAMMFIQTGTLEEISNQDTLKIESYLSKYLPFHASFDGFGNGLRAVDKALVTFGSFIKNNSFLLSESSPLI